MAATDPISKTVACTFDIPYEEFEFSLDGGNLGNPFNFAGLGSLIAGVIDAIIEALLTAVDPYLMILEGKILDLLDWINNILSDVYGFFETIFREKVMNPLFSKLKVYVPPFDIEILPNLKITLPEYDPGIPQEDGKPHKFNLQWLAMVEEFISLLIGLLLLPFKLIYEIIMYIINNLSFPGGILDLMKKIWQALLPSMGFTPGTPSYDSVRIMGDCLMENVGEVIPPIFPSGGLESNQEVPFTVLELFTNTPIEKSFIFPATQSSGTIRIKYEGTECVINKAYISSGDEGVFSFEMTPINRVLNENNPHIDIPITRLIPYDALERKEVTIIIQFATETGGGAKNFTVATTEITAATLLKKYVTQLGGVWDEDVMMFGIRNDTGPQVTNDWRDILGVVVKTGSTRTVIAAQGTTRPGYFRMTSNTSPPTDDNPNGITPWIPTIMAFGYHEEIWAWGGHLTGEKRQYPVGQAKYDLGVKPHRFWIDTDRNGIQKREPTKTGYNDLNWHTTAPASSFNNPPKIGRWSYGCQVVRNSATFYSMMDLIANNVPNYSTRKYSYMLFKKSDVQDLWDLLVTQFGINF
jgi:hypothetical protein